MPLPTPDFGAGTNNNTMKSAIGPLGDILGGIFGMGSYKNPADAASPYYNQIPGTIKPYYDPYINAGKRQLPQLEELFGSLMKDPNALLSKFGKGYQQSPGFEFSKQQGLGAIGNAAAAGGMAGTPQHQQQAGELATNLSNQDYGNYMNQLMQLFGMGTQGAQGINQMGFNASTGLAGNLANSLMNQGNLAYAGQQNENQNKGGGFGDILSGAISLGSLFL